MTQGWPGNPIASAVVYDGGESNTNNDQPGLQQQVWDPSIEFSIQCTNAQSSDDAMFTATVYKLVGGTYQAWTWGTIGVPSGGVESLNLVLTMTDPVETYRINYGGAPWGKQPDTAVIDLIAVQPPVIGTFWLDFVPISIIYCPPDQDMTASLSQSDAYGTRFTMGTSATIQQVQGFQFSAGNLGVDVFGIGQSDSQTLSNQSTSGLEISHFRNSVVTADNQRAVGRAYWGPLNDVFVLLANPAYSAVSMLDGTISVRAVSIDQVLIVPAWRLLRPLEDPIANAIPADVRRRILQTDPFLTNLDLFFPDSGADLSLAADSSADPSQDERAELIGEWWLDSGTELSYSLGDSHKLFSNQTQELSYSSKVTFSDQMSVGQKDALSAALTLDGANNTSIGYQTSKETSNYTSVSAACFLIRNQNTRDFSGVAIYYDRLFSTFMFRRVLVPSEQSGVARAWTIAGTLRGPTGLIVTHAPVQLSGADFSAVTCSDAGGTFKFPGVPAGEHELAAGGIRQLISIADTTPGLLLRIDLVGVRRVIDFTRSSIWELTLALGISRQTAYQLGRDAGQVTDDSSLASVAGVSADVIARWKTVAIFPWDQQLEA